MLFFTYSLGEKNLFNIWFPHSPREMKEEMNNYSSGRVEYPDYLRVINEILSNSI